MDALMAALVAAFLIHATDRTAWLAGKLGARTPVVCGMALAVAATNALAALGGAWLAPEMSPNARDLLLALALLASGIGAFWSLKPPRTNERIGMFLAGFVGAATLALGDRTLFVTLALAARATPSALAGPALAGFGATLGALAIVIPAALLGERGRRKLPVTAIRIGIGVVLTVAGTIQALGALRLI